MPDVSIKPTTKMAKRDVFILTLADGLPILVQRAWLLTFAESEPCGTVLPDIEPPFGYVLSGETPDLRITLSIAWTEQRAAYWETLREALAEEINRRLDEMVEHDLISPRPSFEVVVKLYVGGGAYVNPSGDTVAVWPPMQLKL